MFLAETSIQLVPDGTLLLHLLLVVVMVAVVNRTLLRPINKILEERDKHILGRVDEAKEMLKTREEHLAEYYFGPQAGAIGRLPIVGKRTSSSCQRKRREGTRFQGRECTKDQRGIEYNA